MSSIKEHIIQTLYLYTEKLKENFLMEYKQRERLSKQREKERRLKSEVL